MNIEFYKHNIINEDIRELEKILHSWILTTGKEVDKFEVNFAAYMNCKYCIATTSWTSAAQIVLRFWNISPGDEVIIPDITYVSTANVVAILGAKPVFVDINPVTGLMDLQSVEKAISAKTKAIIPVHLFGSMVDIRKLKEISGKHKLKILEDAAHAIESQREGYKPGNLTDAACFSFYATKTITCGEGGAIVTNNKKLADYARLAVRAGTNKSITDRSVKPVFEHWDCDFVSGKSNMTNIQASLLNSQLKRINLLHERRKKLYRYYLKKIVQKKIPVKFPIIPNECNSSLLLFVILVNPRIRDNLLDFLKMNGVGVAVNFRPVHLLKIYKKMYKNKGGEYPNAETFGASCITLPFYPLLRRAEIDQIINLLEKGLKKFK